MSLVYLKKVIVCLSVFLVLTTVCAMTASASASGIIIPPEKPLYGFTAHSLVCDANFPSSSYAYDVIANGGNKGMFEGNMLLYLSAHKVPGLNKYTIRSITSSIANNKQVMRDLKAHGSTPVKIVYNGLGNNGLGTYKIEYPDQRIQPITPPHVMTNGQQAVAA